MGKSVTQKILESHLVAGQWHPGGEIAVRIDQTLTQDATGTMAMLEFEAMGCPRVRTELSVSYVDHNMMQLSFENADDHRYLRTSAARYGIVFSRPGNGICHQVHLERFAVPGKTLLGSDSHTPTCGGMAMVAIGAGGLDVAAAMAGQPFHMACPKVIGIRLTGRLPDFVAAKDVILRVLQALTTKGNVGCVAEYFGPGVETLTVPERATITNMGAELGVTCSVFPSDEQTRQFLAAQGRPGDYAPLAADADAAYDRVIEIDLSALEPMVACPSSPDNVKTVRELAGLQVHQVCIGSCTNSSYRDLMTAAAMLRGRRLPAGTELIVAPGSRQVVINVLRDGGLADLLAAGARLDECACGFCIGAAQAPATGSVSVRTNNRNFSGRSGTSGDQVYLVSPETAAATALAGKLTDPRTLGKAPAVRMPEKFLTDDSMLVFPLADGSGETVLKGPNIGDPPAGETLPDELRGRAVLKVGDKITTDHIMPAGRLLRLRSNIPEYAKHVFENVDAEFASRAAALRDQGQAAFIVGGLSYGQGSSREHAAICPRFLGVRAVVAKSFERIHTANLVNFGILPLVFADEADYDRVLPGDELRMDGLRTAVGGSDTIQVDDVTQGFTFAVRLDAS
ncbi:MAG TPA: aconitate hydratase, partial [Phycisphaerae bacterium]|nr:aconitate hydratase [Phycisphaerae bacterium]